MQVSLFTPEQFDKLAQQVVEVLGTVGLFVGDETVHIMAREAGCRESAQGRILFSPAQVQDNTARLRETHGPSGTEPAALHPRGPFQTAFGNLVPRVHDYSSHRTVAGDTGAFRRLVRFAHSEPRVSTLSIPLARNDVTPELEQLDAVAQIAELTDKPIGPVEAMDPEAVPFLARMGEVLGHQPGLFVGQCNCINPPLRLEARTAEIMLRRAAYHAPAMMTTMTRIAGAGPVDVWGCVVLGTAEIVAGQIIAGIIDKEARLLGYAASTQLDMRTGGISASTPQTTQVDAGICQLIARHFGGGTAVGGRGYVGAKRPGLQAVFERFLKAAGYAAFVDRGLLSYPGTGNLDNGGAMSPEQYLLDLEIMEGLDQLWSSPVDRSDDDTPERIREGILDEGGDFLGMCHTLQQFREEAWEPRYFTRGADTADEGAILDACHEQYLETLKAYEPATHPEDAVRELRAVHEEAARWFVDNA